MTDRPSSQASPPRRELASRNTNWARALAATLGRIGVRPNAVSVASIVMAFLAATAFAVAPVTNDGARASWFVMAACGIQLRLLCNLIDGMLAVEGGLKSKTGDLYNEIPDRIADVAILVGAGYAARAHEFGIVLGWSAAVCALFTAYLRLLGGSLGLRQYFIGPMAKQHRMFTLTLATLVAAVEALAGWPEQAIRAGLVIIVLGSIGTAIRRVARLARDLDGR